MMRTVAACCALVALPVAIAMAGPSDSRQDASYELTVNTPGSPTGQNFAVDYVNPDDPDGKPPAVRKVVTMLPRGARFDTSAPRHCRASDAELMALGAEACPPGSKLTEGVITVDSGIPGPARIITSDTTFFNNQDELIYLNVVRGTGARVVVRGKVTRRRIVTESPFLPGAPPDGAAIDTAEVNDPVIVTKRGSYITTPLSCPARGFWLSEVRFRYDDGVRQVERDRTSCSS